MGEITAGHLLARVLRSAGVDAVYGLPLAGVDVVPVASVSVAALMAEAHGRVHGRPAAVHRGDGRLAVAQSASAVGGDDDLPLVVASADDLLAAVAPLHAAMRDGGLTLRLDLDPRRTVADVLPPPPPPTEGWVEPDDDLVATLATARRPVVLAGPGVVRARAVPGLHAMAAAAQVGVVNTWGAKGVFHWRSRHHLATAGLQARDFELAGFGDADLIVATGLDPAEAGDDRWRCGPAVEVAPEALAPLSAHWWRPGGEIAVPPLRVELARVTQEGWAATSTPLAPSLVTRHYSQVFGAGGLVAADPGMAGYWVARTFATTELGGAQVPAAAGRAGFAVACAAVARLRSPGRLVLAVVDAPVADVVHDALAAAARLGVPVPVEVWRSGGRPVGADEHVARLHALAHAGTPVLVDVVTDDTQLAAMVEVAGEIVAWAG